MQHLWCVVGTMSTAGGSGKFLRWNISGQLAEVCKQGWLSEYQEPFVEEWIVWMDHYLGEVVRL